MHTCMRPLTCEHTDTQNKQLLKSLTTGSPKLFVFYLSDTKCLPSALKSSRLQFWSHPLRMLTGQEMRTLRGSLSHTRGGQSDGGGHWDRPLFGAHTHCCNIWASSHQTQKGVYATWTLADVPNASWQNAALENVFLGRIIRILSLSLETALLKIPAHSGVLFSNIHNYAKYKLCKMHNFLSALMDFCIYMIYV